MGLRGPFKVPYINALQAGMLVAGITSITNHALAVTYLLQAGGRDAWLGGVLGMPAAALATAALVALSRAFPGHSLVEYLPRVIGRGPGLVLAALYVAYFLAGAAFTLRRTTDWLVDSLLQETPPWLIAGTYLLACLFAAAGGIQVLARTNQFTLVVLTALGILVSVLTAPNKDYGLLRPVLEYGPAPALRATLAALGIFGELSVLGMFAHYVRDARRLARAVLLGVAYAAITMTGPVSGAIAALGFRQGANMPYPTFQQWLMISFARFLERTDLLAVHQWLVGAYVRVGLQLFAAAIGVWQVIRVGRWPWLLAGGALLVMLWAMAFHDIVSFDVFITAVYLPAGIVLGILLPPLLWGVAGARGLLARGEGPHDQAGKA